MLNVKSFLTVDFGAGTLKVAEFEVNESGGLRLKQFGLRSLGAEGAQESTRESAMQKALQELMAEKGIRSKDVNVCAPGFHVFSKFVKLPPVDSSKVTQIIQYEAQQNVPFPLAEVVWDYQILGSAPGGEMEVLLVAIKTDIVEGLFRVTESAGLRLQLADVSPAALCNAFRYNYGDLEDCTMLLDIGAKTSNLLFFEKGKVYSRSINLGANSITQDFANESKLPFPEAEKKKISEGFVSLGGAYEEPENAHQAAISKIARQFMTRLHIQVNQTMQFYRGQQGGSAPQRLFLSGGASLMPYTAQFFAEKLNVPVEYLNPFRNVEIDPAVNLEELARVAHSLGEVVGLGLRNLAHCPVELNLMPESTVNWVQFNQKKPYLTAAVFSLVLVVFASGYIFNQLVAINTGEVERLNREKLAPEARSRELKKARDSVENTRKEADQFGRWIQSRYYWADVLTDLHRILIQVEARKTAELRVPTGVWIEEFITDPDIVETKKTQIVVSDQPAAQNVPPPVATVQQAQPQPVVATTEPITEADFDRLAVASLAARQRDADAYQAQLAAQAARGAGAAQQPVQQVVQPVPVAVPTPVAPTLAAPTKRIAAANAEIGAVYLYCRAVDVEKLGGAANSSNREIAQALVDALKEGPLFDKEQTRLVGEADVRDTNTFAFGVILKLKSPFKL